MGTPRLFGRLHHVGITTPEDAAYSPALRPVVTSDNGNRYLGTQLGGQIAWQPERHLAFAAYYAQLWSCRPRGDGRAPAFVRECGRDATVTRP